VRTGKKAGGVTKNSFVRFSESIFSDRLTVLMGNHHPPSSKEERIMGHKILRLPDVIERVGFSRSSIYAFVDNGTFPKPVQIGIRAVGWLDSDVDDWILDRIEKSRGIGHSLTSLKTSRSSEGGLK
jgi:prophage regulatory protein